MTRLSHMGLPIGAVTVFLLAGSFMAQAEDKPQPPAASSPEMMTPVMGGGMTPMMGGGMMGMMGNGMPPMMGGGMTPVMGGGMMGMYPDGSIAFLKAELKITGEQEAVWNAYASALKEAIQQHHKHMSSLPMKAAPGTDRRGWLQRLADSEARIDAHLQAVKKIRPAAEALYAALGAEQKQKADMLMPAGGAMGMGGMGGMRWQVKTPE
jgi:hypothetical protein